MARYRRLEGTPSQGAIVVRLVKEGDAEVLVEMEVGVEWNPACGTLD